MPIGTPNASRKFWVVVLGVLVVFCTAVAAVYIFDATYFHWAEGSHWRPVVNPHRGTILVFLIAWLGSTVLAIALGLWWVVNRKKSGVPHRSLGALLLLLLVTAGSFVLSPFQYVALAVLILGPGQHSSEFQQSAAIYDSITLLNALILRGAQIDDTLLSFAAYNESPHVVRRLIERGTPINERHYSTKVTALHKAVEGQRYENMELLLEAGANPNIADARGVTPLDLAMKLKDDKMLEMLKRVGSGRARER